MRIVVDRELCDLHGQCVFAAPAIFRLTDDGELEHLAEVGDDQADDARAAQAICPAGAIELLS